MLAAYAALLAGGAAALFVLHERSLLVQTTNFAAFGSAACSVAANVGTGAAPAKGSGGSYTRWMIGIHLGMVLPLAYGAFVGVMAVQRLGQMGLLDLEFAVMASLTAVSIAALVLIFLLRPRKASAAEGALV